MFRPRNDQAPNKRSLTYHVFKFCTLSLLLFYRKNELKEKIDSHLVVDNKIRGNILCIHRIIVIAGVAHFPTKVVTGCKSKSSGKVSIL